MAPDPFKNLGDMLRIITTEVLEGKRISCVEVAAEIDPLFHFQWAIDLEDFTRPGLDMRRVLHCHIEVGIPPLEIFFLCEKLDCAVEVPETIGRKVKLGVQVASGEVVLPSDLDPDALHLHFQGLERFNAIQLAPLDV